MEHFEREKLSGPPPTPWGIGLGMWMTLVIQQQAHKQSFLDHINSIDPVIRFTVEGNKKNGSIPFLDTLIIPEADKYLSITVYCKPTHTDQYLQWEIHHNLTAKYSIMGTLIHRAKTACTRPQLSHKELQYLREALVKGKYPRWANQQGSK